MGNADNNSKFEKIGDLLFDELIHELKNNNSLALFASQRCKFEGWLKVKVIEILLNAKYDASPEQNFRKLFPGNEFNTLFSKEEFATLYPKRNYDKRTKKTKSFDIHIKPLSLLELKTVVSRHIDDLPEDGNKKSQRNIKDNILEVLTDIYVLKKVNAENKAILFLAYPLPENKEKEWDYYLQRIKHFKIILKRKPDGKLIRDWELIKNNNLKSLKSESFYFSNKIRGVVYFGIV